MINVKNTASILLVIFSIAVVIAGEISSSITPGEEAILYTLCAYIIVKEISNFHISTKEVKQT